MKKIAGLLKEIDRFVILAEYAVKLAALKPELGKGVIPEHLALQAIERATDDEGKPAPQLGKEAYMQLVDFIEKLHRDRYYLDKIPDNSKWTILFPKAHLKAIVEKIREAGHPVIILKTFLAPHMYETGSQGLLLEFLHSIKSEKDFGDLKDKIKDARKLIKTLDRLLTKKFPISLDDIKRSPPEVQKILAGVVSSARGRPLTETFIKDYKIKLESELQKMLQRLPPRSEMGGGSE